MRLNIQIKATHFELTDTLRNYIYEKLQGIEKLLNLNNDTTPLAEVEIEKTIPNQHQGQIYRAEINLSINGEMIRAESTDMDIYVAIIGARDEVERILRKQKTKRIDIVRRSAGRAKDMLRGFFSRKSK